MIPNGGMTPGFMPGINDYPPQFVTSSGYNIKFYNYTANTIYISDGSKTKPRMLEPLLDRATGVPKGQMPQGASGKVIAIRSIAHETPSNSGNLTAINYQDAFWDKICTPPAHPGPELENWCHISKEYNIVLAGSPKILDNFIKTYGTVYEYIKCTDFATQFENTLNYGIMNCTGKHLYQVDDTGSDDIGTADIIAIPFGNNLPVPLWDQQIANERFNVDTSRPFIRTFRYELINVNETSYTGSMRERIFYWDADTLSADGFLYIPQFHVCIFERYDDALEFIRQHKTVESWEKSTIKNEMVDIIDAHCSEIESKLAIRNRIIVKGATILVSLQIAWKLGELIIWAARNKAEKRKQTKTGENKFSSGFYNGAENLSNSIGSVFL